ncbi:phospholipid-transporting ATPase ABCA3-like [Anopheles ziemanni]|uniref:phospholipid-transporting ATPase ABCA3-like n=1 Tax=Anopheles coustani TaxID=139045 RepID=UPI002659461F|nr:phospholipid-transporting ATPase ABCA3-like [Anopheles coustani]XP_058172569.1 phospholipid-transporting ATPase ABCA3-like [Anopheles ziemanni]
MATSSWDKFILLLWKNWIIQKRHYVQTLFEILIPVIACVVLIVVRGLVDADVYDEPTTWNPLETNTIRHMLPELNPNITPPFTLLLAYSPQSPLTDRIMQRAVEHIQEPIELAGYPNAHSMENFFRLNYSIAGVEFPESYGNLNQLPDNITVSIRFPGEMRTLQDDFTAFWANWATELMFPAFQIAGARERERDDGGYPANYYNESFIAVQSAVSRALILERDPTIQLPEVYLNRFPYPPYYSDPLLTGFENLLPLIVVIAFFYTAINTVKYITVEKEKQLKEAMKIMGLPSWLHWSAWFVKCLVLLIISISLIVVLLCVNITTNTDLAIFEYAEWTVVWFYLFVFSITTICFCFMVSTFFSKANIAAGIAGLLWFILIVPYNIAFSNYDDMTAGAKVAICLFSNSAMSFGFMLMMRHEGTATGLQWSNLFDPVSVDDDFSVGDTMLMLLADAIIYLMIALYVEKVFPGDFGIAEPWYFLYTKKFWCKDAQQKAETIPADVSNMEGDNVEREPDGKYAGIQIRKLRKEFSKKKAAVQGLNLNMYEDQITVLLGHNGAGKTTTMSMLTGMFSPSSGTAIVNGYDIRNNIDAVRGSLGLCPQHNVLFNEMTVAEHIEFFARLKGVPRNKIKDEIRHYVQLLELEDKLNKQSHTLSGGMKRKLSVGIALCGGSKVVLCDEPTSGMDPSARRALWDLLIKEKQGRTILLSTHFMDEADILGDRIAIMAEGELKACGSSFFLKKRFGVGYRLICVKGANCDRGTLTGLLRKHIPNIDIDTDIGSELSYVLNENYTAVFQDLLRDLEDNVEQCGITSYGISLTTLEEVFLRVGSDSYALDQKSGHDDGILDTNGFNHSSTVTLDTTSDTAPLLDGSNLVWNQLFAMFLKKYISTKRSWIQMLVQAWIPIYFVIVTVIIVRTFPGQTDLPPIPISVYNYSATNTILEATATSSPFIDGYRAVFRGLPGNHRLEVTEKNMTERILELSVANIGQVNREYMAAASITNTNHTVWWNPTGFHTAPLALNFMYNAMIKSINAAYEITIINKPLPFKAETRFTQLEAGNNLGFQISFNTGFAMSFIAALYIMFYIKERTSRAKLLQFVSGINVFTFWIVSFLWDFMTYVITALLYIITLAVFQEEGWATFEELGRVFLVLIVFGIAFLPVTYLFSFWFEVPATGFVKMMIVNIFSGTIFFTAVFLLKFDAFDLSDVANGLEWAFMIFPLFSLSQSLSNINVLSTTETVCREQCTEDTTALCSAEYICSLLPQCCDTNIFSWENTGINRQLMYMGVVGMVGFLILMGIEFRVIERIFKRRRQRTAELAPLSEDSTMDDDVWREKNRVKGLSNAEIGNSNLIVSELTKYYGKFLAVNQLSVSVDGSECFGLLGVNGAGKTSTFKMLTGDENISAGEAWVKGISLKSSLNQVHKVIGYCPQFDALLEDLTGRETMKIFALLRGIPKHEIGHETIRLAGDLNFMKHIDKRVKEYSGGNKRKLSTALALLANPAVVYLDEPTTGMDPGAKRHLWNVIINVKKAGKSIVLTSHSMEECEALCTRLAIMVNGEFKCLGSTQHLKNKFSKGYFLTIKLNRTGDGSPANADPVKDFVARNFSQAVLKEEYHDSLTYHITQSELKWSTMFGLMEEAKRTLDIEDYALGQTSLEQVFLFFTKYQRVTDDN